MSDVVQVKLKQIFKRCCPREGDQHVEISSVENALRKMNLMADSEAKVLRRALREQDSNRDRFVSFAEFERAIRTVVERKVATQSQNALGRAELKSPLTESPPLLRSNSLRSLRIAARDGSGRRRKTRQTPSPEKSRHNSDNDAFELVEQTTARMIFDLLDDQGRGFITYGDLRERWGEIISDQPLPTSFTRLSDDEYVTLDAFAQAFEEPPAPNTPGAGRRLTGTPGRSRATTLQGPDSVFAEANDGAAPIHRGSPLLITAGVSALQRRIRSLQTQLQSAHEETDHLRREVQHTHDSMTQSSELAEKEIANAEAATESVRVDLERKYHSDLADLRTEHEEALRQQRTRIEELEDTLSSQSSKADGKMLQLDELRGDKTRLQKEVLRLQQELEHANVLLVRKDREITLLRLLESRNEELQQANADLSRQSDAFGRELDQRQREIAALKDQVEELQERLRERGNPALHREPVVGESLATELAQMEAIDTESHLVQETRTDRLAAQNKALQEQLDALAALSARLAERWDMLEKERNAERDTLTLRNEVLQQRAADAESARAFAEALLKEYTKARQAEERHADKKQRGAAEGEGALDSDMEEMDAAVREQLRALVREAHDAKRAQKELSAYLKRSRTAAETQRQELTAEMDRLSKQLLKAGHREVALQNTLSEASSKLLAEQAAFVAYKDVILSLDKPAKAARGQPRPASTAPRFVFYEKPDDADLVQAAPIGTENSAVGQKPKIDFDHPNREYEAPNSRQGTRISIDEAVDDARTRRASLDAALAESALVTGHSQPTSPMLSPQRFGFSFGGISGIAQPRRPSRIDTPTKEDAAGFDTKGNSSLRSLRPPAGGPLLHLRGSEQLGTSSGQPLASSAFFAGSRRALHEQTSANAALRQVMAPSPTPSLTEAVHASHGGARHRLTALSQKLDKSIERASTPLPQSPVPSAGTQPTMSALPPHVVDGDNRSSGTPLSWQAASPTLLRRLSANPSPTTSTVGSVLLAPHDKLDVDAASDGHRKTMDFFSRINSQLDRSISKTQQELGPVRREPEQPERFGFN